MADYKEMYLQLLRATELAINILTEAQQAAEERYITSADPKLIIMQKAKRNEEDEK